VGARDSRSRLIRLASKADIAIPSALADRLVVFLELLLRWNRKINLTSLDNVDSAISRLLLEPLAAARFVKPPSGRLIDLGSGGGSPAIPLALALSELDLTMVEVKARKAAFLREAVRVLELPHALVENTRFQDLLERHGHQGTYSAVSVRAVRIETSTLRQVARFLGPDGLALLFRGQSGPVELPDADPLAWTGTYPLLDPLGTGSRLSVFRRVE
jgi:16S rRNA (guanine527-N7)-methyltransferase